MTDRSWWQLCGQISAPLVPATHMCPLRVELRGRKPGSRLSWECSLRLSPEAGVWGPMGRAGRPHSEDGQGLLCPRDVAQQHSHI